MINYNDESIVSSQKRKLQIRGEYNPLHVSQTYSTIPNTHFTQMKFTVSTAYRNITANNPTRPPDINAHAFVPSCEAAPVKAGLLTATAEAVTLAGVGTIEVPLAAFAMLLAAFDMLLAAFAMLEVAMILAVVRTALVFILLIGMTAAVMIALALDIAMEVFIFVETMVARTEVSGLLVVIKMAGRVSAFVLVATIVGLVMVVFAAFIDVTSAAIVWKILASM